jgi:endoglucanase
MGMISQFGVPADKKWMEVMDNFLAYATKNHINITYWAAGPWWNNYPLSVEPDNGMDKPQMKILSKYLPVVNYIDTLTNKQ